MTTIAVGQRYLLNLGGHLLSTEYGVPTPSWVRAIEMDHTSDAGYVTFRVEETQYIRQMLISDFEERIIQTDVVPEPGTCPYDLCTEHVEHTHGTDRRYAPRKPLAVEIVGDERVPKDTVIVAPEGFLDDPTAFPPEQVGVIKIEPTKQREGDQVLPDGSGACVQDEVIRRMEESKKVGLERYGSTLLTFNGRKGIQDVAEEARDLFVYLTQMEMEATATRETLIEVVTQALTEHWLDVAKDQIVDSPEGHCADLAEVAVDRIMGWVIGQVGE